MSAALQREETARDRLLDSVLDQLAPLYATIYNGDMILSRQAACDAMDPYYRDETADLNVAAVIVACGLTSMRVLQMCMAPGVGSTELARLSRTADTLGRTAQRHRANGLHPAAEPKPAASKPRPALRSVPQPAANPPQETCAQPQVPEAPAPRIDDPLSDEDCREIYRAATEGRLDDILADDTAGGLGDRMRAFSAQQGAGDHIVSTTGIPRSPR